MQRDRCFGHDALRELTFYNYITSHVEFRWLGFLNCGTALSLKLFY